MNSQQIRKLPGAKKEFPFVKAKIDNRKTVKLAIKPAVRNPDEIQLVPPPSAKADVAPLVTNKVGFGYQGFGSTSITAAIPKHEIIRPLADHRDKNIHPRDWNSSSKPELIKEKAVTEPKPFKARPVPRSHYDAPLPPVSTKVKVGTTATAKKVKKTPEPVARHGLVSRVWHSVVDPILHPVKDESAGEVITPEPEKNKDVAVAEVSPVVVHPQPEPTADDPAVQVQPTADITTDAAASAHPGLVSRMWHSVVDPILHPTKPEPNDDETLAAGHDVDEKPDENQPDVQQVVKDVQAPHQVPEAEPEGETVPSTPEAVPDQPKVETVDSLPSRIWHSIVDPVMHPKTGDESVPIPDEKGAAADGKDRKKHRRHHKKKSHHKDRASRSVM